MLIKRVIKDIRANQELEIRVNKDRYIKFVDTVIGHSKEKALVFLAVNGTTKLKEIEEKIHLKLPNVSRAKKALEKEGLIYLPPESGLYTKPRWAYVLHIDEHIRQKFGIKG